MGCCGKSPSVSKPKSTGLFKDCGCGCNGKKQEEKFMISLLSAVLFFVISHPTTFKFMRNLLGDWVSNSAGCPSVMGLILHAFIFMMITWGLMNLKKYKE